MLSTSDGRKAVDGILDGARDEVRQLLGEQRHVVEALRDGLLARDELIGDEITEVIAAALAAHQTEVIDVRQ